MPIINDIEIEIEVEVYCATCGNGLCLNTTYTMGRSRGIRQFRVEVCERCMERKEEEIESLKDEIIDLRQELQDD